MEMVSSLLSQIESNSFKAILEKLYTADEQKIAYQVKRYSYLLRTFASTFGEEKVSLFSAPGRTEVGGNHTDHNYGKVLAASINLDAIAAATPCEQRTITIYSEGYPEPFIVHLDKLEKEDEPSTTTLIKGLVAAFLDFGYEVGGFNAYITSDVVNASGLSSSAAIEMLLCSIINHFYNEGKLDRVTYAKLGQYAENKFWNKPSGLLDQMACAIGGLITIDFNDPEIPQIKYVPSQSLMDQYDMVIVQTGGDHANLTEEYAAVPNEMRQVAEALGKSYLNEVTLDQLLAQLSEIRPQLTDRAILRAVHYLLENERVDVMSEALKMNQFHFFLEKVTESGNSSWKYLQNCYVADKPKDQPITYALTLTEIYLASINEGACRVHGGGFAGVIQAYIPKQHTADFVRYIEDKVGEGTTYIVNIRPYGAVALKELA
ncbi:galactokinase [Paenibacillus yanchengensis]|uniref:Galactokinase n=1 Tax=Paenibacillus yanchengensis TaxID=2035833 RepID=A0ABW4YER3_9BACL